MPDLTPKTVAESHTVLTREMLPSDANPSGNIHGGEIMKMIDSCAGIAASRHSRRRVVTARIDEMSFLAPVLVGDVVTAMAAVNDVGHTSMEIGVRVLSANPLTGETKHVASAYLVFVALDERGRPTPVPPLIAESDAEKRRMARAKLRRAHRLARGPQDAPA